MRKAAHILTAAALAAFWSCSTDDAIVIVSKNFSENVFLGELFALQIERETDYRVVRRLNLGSTFLCHQALLSGEADLYPEYTGTALTSILGEAVIADRRQALEAVRSAYRESFDAVWLDPLGFNSTYAVLVRQSEPESLRSLSDLSQVAENYVIGFNFEFQQREDGYDGLQRTYGLEFAGEPKTLDLNLVYQALAEERIDVGVGNSTHGLIERLDLRELEDDRRYFPPYDAAAVVRLDALEQYPELRKELEELSGAISLEQMRRINRQLDVEQRRADEVAKEFLDARQADGIEPKHERALGLVR